MKAKIAQNTAFENKMGDFSNISNFFIFLGDRLGGQLLLIPLIEINSYS